MEEDLRAGMNQMNGGQRTAVLLIILLVPGEWQIVLEDINGI